MRTKVLALLPGLIPSTIIGIVKPLLRLANNGEIDFKVDLTFKTKVEIIDKFDVIVFCRNCEFKDLELLYYAKSKGKKIIYEIDDNFFEISLKSELGKYHRNPSRVFIIEKFFELADMVHVYSNPLKEKALMHTLNVKKIKSYFDFSLLNQSNEKGVDTNKIKIVFATSRGNLDDSGAIIENALINVLEKYGDLVEVHVWGSEIGKISHYKQVKNLSFIRDYNKFVKSFEKEKYNIGLAPLQNTIFERSKTNNKYREYGAFKIAGIYSNVDVYTDSVVNRVNGLIVEDSSESWFKAIEELILNNELREKIISNANNDIKENYSIEAATKVWANTIEEVKLKQADSDFSEVPIYNVKYLVLQEKSRMYYRTNSLVDFLNFYQAPFKIDDLDSNFFEGIGNWDVIVIFFDTIDGYNSNRILIQLIAKKVKHLIIDIGNLKLDPLIQQENISYISSEKVEGAYLINDSIPLTIIEDEKVEDLYMKMTGKSIISELIDKDFNYLDIESDFKSYSGNKMRYFEDNSPVKKWAHFLSRLPNLDYIPIKKGNVGLIQKVKMKIYSKIKKVVSKILNPIKSRLIWLNKGISTMQILYEINVKKKYK